jgi:hypothetical protein
MAGRLKRFLSQAADALFIPGNAYNSNTDHWNPATTKVGIAGMLADQFVPGGSNLVGMAANGGLFGSGISQGLQRENTYNGIADQFGETRQGLADYLQSQRPEFGEYNPQVSVGQPQYASVGSFAPSVPTMPSVQAQAPWSPLGTNTGNVLHGGSLGNWASQGQGQQRQYGQAGGSFTPWGAGVVMNDGWGDAARGFGIGAGSGGSGGGFALADAMKANAKNKD